MGGSLIIEKHTNNRKEINVKIIASEFLDLITFYDVQRGKFYDTDLADKDLELMELMNTVETVQGI